MLVGLIYIWYDEVVGEIGIHTYLHRLPSNVHSKPLITSYCNQREVGGGSGMVPKKVHQSPSDIDRDHEYGLWVNLRIQGNFRQYMNLFVGIQVTEIDSRSQIWTDL